MTYRVQEVEASGIWLDEIQTMDLICFPSEWPVSFDGAYWWVAVDEDEIPVAYAGLKHLHGSNGYLCRAGVLPSARGNRLQRRLVRARERGARSMGLTRLFTYTSPDNVTSSNNLIACGYRLYRPDISWGVPGALYFWRDL